MKKLTAVATASLLASSISPVTASADNIFCRWYEDEKIRFASSTSFPDKQAFLARLPEAYRDIARELLRNASLIDGKPLEEKGLCRVNIDKKDMFNR